MNKEKMKKLLRNYMAGSLTGVLAFILCGARADGIDPKKVYHIAVSTQAFGEINTNDAAAALKAWALTMEREQNLNARLETKLLKNSAKEIRDLYLAGEFDGFGLSMPELAAMDIQPEHVYVGNRGDGYTLRYVLISHASLDVPKAKKLEECRLVSCDNNQMLLSEPWLDILAAEHAGGRKIKPPVMVKNFSKAILQVFFRQADAAVVTREAFDLACELNPQLRKEMEVVFESPPLITVAFLLKPSSGRTEDLEILERLVLDIGKNPGGRQMLTIIQSSRMEKCAPGVLDETLRFLATHERLVAGIPAMEAR